MISNRGNDEFGNLPLEAVLPSRPMNQGILIRLIALAKLVLVRDAFAHFSWHPRGVEPCI
jgi:hypothetical protein